MGFKFNWGHGIALAILIFVLFIGSFVYRSLFGERFDHKLISKKYYEEEIHYQEEIDRLNNAKTLDKDLKTNKTQSGLQIIFPAGMEYDSIQGSIKMLYVKDRQFDYIKDFRLHDSIILIPDKLLVHGRFHLKVDWYYQGKGYQFREKIDY